MNNNNNNILTYIWSQGMVDKIAKKVAEEPMENRVLFEGTPFEVDEGNYTENTMPSVKKKKRPQHVIDEEEADLARERQREIAQMEMFDDPYMNWSGHR